MPSAKLRVSPSVDRMGNVDWTVSASSQRAYAEMSAWEVGDVLDFAEVSWIIDSGPVTTKNQRRGPKGHNFTIIRQINVGDWVLVRYEGDGADGQEFAKVCGIRQCHSGGRRACKICISWGYAVECAGVSNRQSGATATMRRARLTDDCMVPSNHFDFISLEQIEDIVLERPDDRGVITTVDYGLHKGWTMVVDIFDGLWLDVADKREDQCCLKLGHVSTQQSVKPEGFEH